MSKLNGLNHDRKIMPKLNDDILYAILQELQDDKKTICSCLSIYTLHKLAISIVWKDPWKYLKKGREESLLIVLISHIPDNSRDYLGPHLTILIKKPLFDYVSHCKHLDLSKLEEVINTKTNNLLRKTDSLLFNTIKKEVFKLFVIGNMKFTHLYISSQFDQAHLIPGT